MRILLLGLGRWGLNHLRNLHSLPVQPAVAGLFPYIPKLPRTEQAVKEILSLPIHGEMSPEAADNVCHAVGEFYGSKV